MNPTTRPSLFLRTGSTKKPPSRRPRGLQRSWLPDCAVVRTVNRSPRSGSGSFTSPRKAPGRPNCGRSGTNRRNRSGPNRLIREGQHRHPDTLRAGRQGREHRITCTQQTQAAIAHREGITRARVTQVMRMLRLPPAIQEHIFSLLDPHAPSSVTKRAFRSIKNMVDPHDQPREFLGDPVPVPLRSGPRKDRGVRPRGYARAVGVPSFGRPCAFAAA
jgi:hypothetical protein